MTYNSIRHLSYSVSIILHLILLGLFLIITISVDYSPTDYVELSFGTSGNINSSGAIGDQIEKVEELAKPEEQTETVDKNIEVKEIELPKAENTSKENVIKPADKDEDVSLTNKVKTEKNTESEVTKTGQGNKAEGDGSLGFDIDWGGKGKRKIYSFTLPSYPEGVHKEIDIRLRFTILPDGTVGTIIPLIKADTRLENAAINSLRKWRFEALAKSQKQVEQAAVIVFPYRLQ